MDTLKGIAKLWPAAGRGWELINGCRTEIRRAPIINVNRAHFARPTSAIESGMHDGHQAQLQQQQQQQQQFPTNRMLSHSRSLSHVKGDIRGSMTPSPLSADSQRLIHHRSQIFPSPVYQPAPPSASFAGPYNLQTDPIGSSIPSWGGDAAGFARSTFNHNNPPSGTHSRSASVGSQREQQINANANAPMPHFWSDPFTDSTLLTSNYYGLPVMDRQTQIAIDHNSQIDFGQVDFTPFDGTTF